MVACIDSKSRYMGTKRSYIYMHQTPVRVKLALLSIQLCTFFAHLYIGFRYSTHDYNTATYKDLAGVRKYDTPDIDQCYE